MRRAFALLIALAAAAAGEEARIFWSKSFPGSAPPYEQVTLDRAGNAEYGEAPNDEQPLKFRLTDAETEAVFGLADKLDHFRHPLESPLKVAFMGTKIFRWEAGAEKPEVKFNYSEDPAAQALLDWFERMAESAQARIELERAARYDRLGVDQALRNLRASMDRNRLVGLDQYLPMLDRIANNDSYMHTARMKAAEMAEAIRGAKPASKP
jgi:hypothetical protein